MESTFLAEFLYRGSYGVLIVGLFWARQAFRKVKIIKSLLLAIIGGVFIWGRFIEPQQIVVQETTIDLGVDVRIAVISDTHLGVRKDWSYLQRVVHTLNEIENVDMLLIAGDFLYKPLKNQSLEQLFSPLADSEVPVYAVLGNHDIGIPGGDYRLPLTQALEANRVSVLHNDIIEVVDKFYLVGFGPHLGGEDNVRIVDEFSDDDVIVALTHNPDTVMNYKDKKVDLTIAGHTHCGQIRPPVLYPFIKESLLPIEGDFDCGLTEEENTSLFITSGIGEVMLPVRFNAPPTIDIIQI